MEEHGKSFAAGLGRILAMCPVTALFMLLRSAQGAGVVINEVNYEPADETRLTEFVELYNSGTNAVDMSGWYFSAGLTYQFPANTVLQPARFLVVAENPAALASNFSVSALGPFAGHLSNQGEKITLRDGASNKVDEVDYGVGSPWPTAAAGGGGSMELINPALDNSLGGSWRTSGYPMTNAPTPGATNSVWATNAPPQVRQVAHAPQQPAAGQSISVTAKVTDPNGVASVQLEYQVVLPGNYIPAFLPLSVAEINATPYKARPVNPAFTNASGWTSLAMRDDGTGGDAVPADGIYTAMIPGQVNRALVRYRITARDTPAASARLPYADDPSLNYACFVYNGLVPYVVTNATVQAGGVPYTYGTNILGALPVYHFLTRSNDLRECWAYSSTDYQARGPAYFVENWESAVVYNGDVYDHVGYRLRGANGRYQLAGKRSMRWRFNKGREFQALDRYGEKYPVKWSGMNTAKMFGNRLVGSFGLVEALDPMLWEMAGVPAPQAHWFHWRVVDGAEEVPSGGSSQYYGDFCGLYMASEIYDSRFVDANDLPDGNLYKLNDTGSTGKDEQQAQGRFAVTNAEDYFNIRNTLNGARTEAEIRNLINCDKWYRWHAVAEAVRDYDFWPGCDKNMAWFFEPVTGSAYGRLWFLPYDYDDTWGPYWNYGIDEAMNSTYVNTLYPGAATVNKTNLTMEYRNYIREFRDLVWQTNVVNGMIDDLAATIAAFVPADRDRWRNAPADAGAQDFGTLEAKVQDMKDFAFAGGRTYPGGSTPEPAGGRARVLDDLAGSDGDSSSIPNTPTVTAAGSTNSLLDNLTFQCSDFSDPQGNDTFAALLWRLGEVTDTNLPAYNPARPKTYEAPALWQSSEITTFTNTITIPYDELTVWHRYRVRARMKDTSGRWSHWSAPVEFVFGEPSNTVAVQESLRISELMYAPPGGDDDEFIELHNTSPSTALNISGVAFANGIDYVFPLGATMQPGAYLLLTRAATNSNFSAFRARYGLAEDVPVFGPYAGKFSDSGEEVTLRTFAGGTDIASFTYNKGRDWPLPPDGAGHSLVPLVFTNQAASLDWAAAWRASAHLGGSPGREDPAPVRDVVINEIVAHTDYTNDAMPEYDSNDWLELFNTTGSPVALGNWYLSDDVADLRKWAIPATNAIGPLGWIMFDEVTGFHSPITNGFGLNKGGEKVFLSYLPGTGEDRVADCIEFEGQENGFSLGRYTDGGSNWYALVPTPAAANAPPLPRVVISRIMYHPASTPAYPADNTADEYVEIENATTNAVPLWTEAGTWRVDGGISCVFPTGLVLSAGAKMLVVPFTPSDSARMHDLIDVYGPTDGVEWVLGPWVGVLANGGERVSLERPLAPDLPGDPVFWVIVDEVIYYDHAPWPEGVDGTGAPLLRSNPLLAGSDPLAWTSGVANISAYLRWPLDDGSGSVASDNTGHGRPGALLDLLPANADSNTPPVWTAGHTGGGLRLDGVDDVVRANGITVTNYPFTLAAWVCTTNTTSGTAAFLGAGNKLYNYYSIGTAAGKPEIAAHVSEGARARQFATASNSIADGQWHHLAGTFLSETDKCLYVDGVLSATLTNLVFTTNTINRFTAGARDIATPTAFWSGWLDDVNLVARGLTASEIRAVMDSSTGVPDADRDGMPDSWEQHYFGGTNAVHGGADEDWDGDGFSNLGEYIAGTDPTNALACFVLNIPAGQWGVLSFGTLPVSGSDYAGKARYYSLDFRTSLLDATWSGVPAYTNLPASGTPVIYTNQQDSPMYYRGRVRLE